MITGASQGLGRELALIFAREGAAGLSLSARHGDAVRRVRDDVVKIAPDVNVLAIEADVSKPKDIERLIATTLSAFGGRLDVLVNNASTIGPSPMPYLLDYQRYERCRRERLPRLGRLRHLKIRTRRHVTNLGVGAGRDGGARELGGSGEHEYGDASGRGAGRGSDRMVRSGSGCRRLRFPRRR